MESLWEFFFNTGFIYPEKYKFIQPYREKFKETYERLYQNNQNVAVHFTYETDGTIYAHISMLRAYAYTWMIHHYAARPMENKLTGFLVLQQIIRYLNGLYRLPSAKMEYVMTYFRPNNKIVERVFGGFADSLNDPKGCSIDLFSYLSVKKETDLQGKVMKGGWVLRESSALDLWKLNMFYEHHSGGLMMDALNLKEHNMEDIFLEEAYDRMGFARKKKVYSLLRGKDLAAVLIVNLADMGMNLSELINSIKIIIMDQEILRWNTLLAGISMLANNYHYDEIPLLVYPSHYTEKENISIKKQYRLWILNIARHNEQYLEYIKRYRIKLR
jgi:hypothetical protein